MKLCREEYAGQLEYDLGNLTAFDPAPVEASLYLGEGGEDALLETARAITQSLAAQLFGLPSESVQGGRLAHLPTPTTLLPREKPIPRPKPLTKWQKFAQEKGIVKRKRSKLVFDDVEQDWKRRHGYKRANDDLDLPILEASRADKVGAAGHASACRRAHAVHMQDERIGSHAGVLIVLRKRVHAWVFCMQ